MLLLGITDSGTRARASRAPPIFSSRPRPHHPRHPRHPHLTCISPASLLNWCLGKWPKRHGGPDRNQRQVAAAHLWIVNFVASAGAIAFPFSSVSILGKMS
ncbi:hypothetical protein BT67DRAFT_454411 [Trichocladium antarcticum]|uniref:Uncharacterized protein n=1 Tax=Trichocladium antarcticum TaxID=1450529 RepID=A0AAN6UP59_9PEZI|nr:hypothetical protein BT67DRAFT_454411 [Trichocladium antarcticum]